MTMEMTDAKIGRSMQKWEMFIRSQDPCQSGSRAPSVPRAGRLRDLHPPRLARTAVPDHLRRLDQPDAIAGDALRDQRFTHGSRALGRNLAIAFQRALAVGVAGDRDRIRLALERR